MTLLWLGLASFLCSRFVQGKTPTLQHQPFVEPRQAPSCRGSLFSTPCFRLCSHTRDLHPLDNAHAEHRNIKKTPPKGKRFFFSIYQDLGLCVLLDGKFAAVVTAFGAYVVIHYRSAAIAARGELGFLQTVVCSALRCASLRESVFWMWHN